jgi:hypothetical protein
MPTNKDEDFCTVLLLTISQVILILYFSRMSLRGYLTLACLQVIGLDIRLPSFCWSELFLRLSRSCLCFFPVLGSMPCLRSTDATYAFALSLDMPFFFWMAAEDYFNKKKSTTTKGTKTKKKTNRRSARSRKK